MFSRRVARHGGTFSVALSRHHFLENLKIVERMLRGQKTGKSPHIREIFKASGTIVSIELRAQKSTFPLCNKDLQFHKFLAGIKYGIKKTVGSLLL